MEIAFYILIILLLGANLYFSLKKDDEKDNDDEYLIKGIVSEIIENEESQIYKLLDKSDQTVKEFLEKTGEIKSSISGVDQQTRNLISVLNGGLLKWKKENKKTTNEVSKHEKKNYKATKLPHLVKSKEEIDKNILEKEFQVVDARSKNRFLGLEKEPRQNVRSGSIQNSYCLPFGELIDQKDKTFLEKNIIREKFTNIGINNEKNVVFSCGSGITASVLGLAYSIINDKYLPAIYDGSWAEYGKIE